MVNGGDNKKKHNVMSTSIPLWSKFEGLLHKRLPQTFKQLQPSKFDNVVVALSSGVDSSLAAALYSGFPNVHAVYMRNWSNKDVDVDADVNIGEAKGTSSSQKGNNNNKNKKHCDEEEWKEAKRVAKFLNIPIQLVNFEKDYWVDVFEPMLRGYQEGITPNPDVLCNKFVKFGSLVNWLDEKFGVGNYWLVTGHYSRILMKADGNFSLMRGIDTRKDQSYYLSQISRDILSRSLLPMGHMYKTEVREWAKQIGLPTASKPDSQGICFVNNSQRKKFSAFLSDYMPTTPGDIVTIDELTGKRHVWGKHNGIWSLTVGQKIGISMPQHGVVPKGKWFVSERRPETNEIVIVQGTNNPKLFQNRVKVMSFEVLQRDVGQFKRVVKQALAEGTLNIQFKSLQDPVSVTECEIEGGDEKLSLTLRLACSQRAISAGQYCCVYSNDEILGSGPVLKSWLDEP